MPIKVPCTCGARLNVADNLAGRNVRCPNCKTVHQVPDASAFAQVPGPKSGADQMELSPAQPTREEPPAEPPKQGISLKGKGDKGKHSGRVSEPTMMMPVSEVKALLDVTREDDPAPEPAAPPPARPADDDDDRVPPQMEDLNRDTRMRRVEAKEHLKKIKEDLSQKKEEAGTRYIPASSGIAKTRGAEPTMVITKDQLRALHEPEVVDEPPNPEPLPEQEMADTARLPPLGEAPPPVEAPPVPAEKPKSEARRPRSDVRPPEPAPACAHSGGMLIGAAACAGIATLIGLVGLFVRIPGTGYAALGLTAAATLLAAFQALRK